MEIDAGVAFLPRSVVASELATGTLVTVPHSGGEIVRPLGVVSRASRVVSPAVKRFLKALKGTKAASPAESADEASD